MCTSWTVERRFNTSFFEASFPVRGITSRILAIISTSALALGNSSSFIPLAGTTSCTQGSPTSNAVGLTWSVGRSLIIFKTVNDGATLILNDSNRKLEFESMNAAKGANHNGPSGTMIISSPWIRSAIGSIMISYNLLNWCSCDCNDVLSHGGSWSRALLRLCRFSSERSSHFIVPLTPMASNVLSTNLLTELRTSPCALKSPASFALLYTLLSFWIIHVFTTPTWKARKIVLQGMPQSVSPGVSFSALWFASVVRIP